MINFVSNFDWMLFHDSTSLDLCFPQISQTWLVYIPALPSVHNKYQKPKISVSDAHVPRICQSLMSLESKTHVDDGTEYDRAQRRGIIPVFLSGFVFAHLASRITDDEWKFCTSARIPSLYLSKEDLEMVWIIWNYISTSKGKIHW